MIDVLIVGSGPTGLMLAVLLEKLGVTFRIIDKNSGPAKESRALGIQPRTLELFQKIGLIDQFLERGIKVQGADLYVSGNEVFNLNLQDMQRSDTAFPFIYFLPQSDTENILIDHLESRGIQIERNTQLLHFTDRGEYVDATIGNQEKLKTRFICGCDGSHSSVRKALGLSFKGEAYGHDFIMTDSRVEWNLPHDRLQIFMEKGKLGIFFPLKDKNLSRIVSIARKNARKESTTLKEVENAFNEASHQNARLSDPQWVTKYHIHHRRVKRMKVGNVFLLGDAAHIHSPAGAQGMNTGIQDANNLAWKIKAALVSPEFKDKILKTYELERLPIASKLINFTDRFFSLAVSDNYFVREMRKLFVPLISRFARKSFFSFISQLDIHYHSNFMIKGNHNKLLESGMRAPDISMEMAGYQYYVLAMKSSSFSSEERASVRSEALRNNVRNVIFITDDTILKLYKVKEEGLFLVRPDGYIGWVENNLRARISYPAFTVSEGRNELLEDTSELNS